MSSADISRIQYSSFELYIAPWTATYFQRGPPSYIELRRAPSSLVELRQTLPSTAELKNSRQTQVRQFFSKIVLTKIYIFEYLSLTIEMRLFLANSR